MAKIEIKLNSAGIRELLTSPGVAAAVKAIAFNSVKSYSYASQGGGKTRARAFVSTKNFKAIEGNYLLRDIFG